MPRGDKPTTPALAVKDGWVYEDTLPASITKEEYDWWFKESLVLDGVRMGPPLTTKPQSTTETLLPCPFCGSAAEPTNMFNQDERLIGCSLRKCVLFYSKIRLPEWNTRISPASAAPVVAVEDMTNDELRAATEFHHAEAAKYSNEAAKVWRLRVRLHGGTDGDKQRLADLHARRAGAATAAPPQQPRSNHFPDEALNKGFPDHISRDGTAYYSDGTVLPSAAPVEQSEHVATTASEQSDPSTCPGCAAGRCMVHEPIIRADATSRAKAAAEEILASIPVNKFREMQRFNSTEIIAAIIKRHYEGAR